jgi:hypothetical protein
MPEPKRRELLRQRRVMEEKQAARVQSRKEAAVVMPIRPEPVAAVPEHATIQGLQPADVRAREMYLGLRARLAQNGQWKGDATHGTLLTYVLCTVDIENQGASGVPPAILTAQAKSRDALKLLDLPPEKAAKNSRFGGW